MTDEAAFAEGHHILALLRALSVSDPNETRRAAFKSAATMIRKALRLEGSRPIPHRVRDSDDPKLA
jgi:hypothetical protein